MSKKKILAAVLFIVIGLFIFAFANPADANEAPVLTLTKDNIIIVKGTDYDLLSIASATDDTDKDLEIKVSIEDTTVLKVGEYDLEYSVTDSDGAKDSETIKLTVLDPNGDEDNDKYTNKEEVEADTNFLDEGSHPDYDAAPTITLGANPTSMEVKGAIPTFIATATDVSDGTIEVVITQTINANVLGTYVITFTATDSLGNTTVKTMNFNVVDTTKPVINVTNTDLDITIEVDLADDIKYTEEFGTITDNYDATKNIVAANVIYSVKNADGTYTTVTSIDTSVVATYRATYSATDANGNMATNVVRTVNVVDTAKPVINVTNTDLDMTIDVDLADDSKYTEEFGTITDNYDATKNIVAANVVYSVKNADDTYTTVTSIDTSVVAMYRAIYSATDVNGNIATNVVRTINVVDTVAPVITVIGGAETTSSQLVSTYLSGTSDLNLYYIDFSPMSTGIVNMYAGPGGSGYHDPVIYLYEKTSEGYTYITGNDDGGAGLDASITLLLSSSKEYRLLVRNYSYYGNGIYRITFTPNVLEEGTATVVLQNTTYTDPGATATDSYDGNITSSIVTDVTNVNTAVIGIYTVEYSVSDSSGNTATASREVTVLDPSGDYDEDGYTNQEEYDNDSDYKDSDSVPTDNSPELDIDPEVAFILQGQNYNVLDGVSIIDDFDMITVNTNITDTTSLSIGIYTITYTTTEDRKHQFDTDSRTLVVLDPSIDSDGDGYTNQEEFDNNSDYTDSDSVPTDNDPEITIDPVTVYILEGTSYNVLNGVSLSDDFDTVTISADITDTTTLALGNHIITYITSEDRLHQVGTATRNVVVLAPNGDYDEDGYTNQEEHDADSDMTDGDSTPVDLSPVITVDPITVYMLEGQNYDVMTGVSINDDYNTTPVITVSADITDTTTLSIDTHTITYTSTLDRANQSGTANRSLIVLDPAGDYDGDGYTNQEEYDAETDYTDSSDYPDVIDPLVVIDYDYDWSMFGYYRNNVNYITITDNSEITTLLYKWSNSDNWPSSGFNSFTLDSNDRAYLYQENGRSYLYIIAVDEYGNETRIKSAYVW